jgi:ribosomal protein L20A (L18A)
MKFEININAVISESDPSYKTITELGIEKAIEKIKKDLSSNNVDFVNISIKEVVDESSKN